MEKVFVRLMLLFSALLLTACDMLNPPSHRAPTPPQHMTMNGTTAPMPPEDMSASSTGSGQGRVSSVVSGGIGSRMDSIDRSKLSHALDKPLGRTTAWTNANTGITYSVIPVRKVTINGNSFCRQYQVTVSRDGQHRETSGTACVASDGQWQSV